ncbi:MAG: Fic family protein [Thermoleophilia bacterium]|jgi:Fic family protein
MKAHPRAGKLISQKKGPEPFSAFMPEPLPPQPSINLDADLQELTDKANRAIGRLDSVTFLLPDPALFLYMHIRKEAVLSSQIEGTQSTMSDLLLFEANDASDVPVDDVQEVSNYIKAMQHGLDRLREGFPLSLRLIREIHEVLLDQTRGSDKSPGEFRVSQNWVGGTRPGNALFVPPPPEEVMNCMGALEKFLHGDPVRMPLLVKAGLVHVQFETIHPFLDGNGRIGRLLITFLLCAEGALSEPMLYLSLYLKRNRQNYYDLLQKVREEGAWEEWLRFYLEGIIEVSTQATETSRRIVNLFEEDRDSIQNLGRAATSAFAVHELLKRKAVLSIPAASRELHLGQPTVTSAVRHLEKFGIISEITGKKRGRLFVYSRYLDILKEGSES